MNTPKYLPLLSLLLITSVLKAQGDFRPGYIIKNQQDTVRGLVNYSTRYALSKAFFRESKKSTIVEFTPDQIAGYGFLYDKRYLSIDLPGEEIPGGKVFVKIVQSGPLDLYRYGDHFFVKKGTELVDLPVPQPGEKVELPESKWTVNHSGIVQKKDLRFIQNLEAQVSDCLFLDRNMKYAESTLARVVESYNKCKGYIPPKDPRPLFKLNYAVSASLVKSKFKIDRTQKNRSFSASTNFAYGIGFDLSSPRVTDRLFFSAEAWYTKTFYQSYYQWKSTIQSFQEDVYFDVSYIKVPLSFRYNLLNRMDRSLYMKAGFYFFPVHNYSMTVITEKDTNGIIYVDRTAGDYSYKTPKGGWFSIGYDHTLFGKLRLLTELRYEKGEGYVGTAIQSFSTLSNVNLMMGLRF